MTPKARVVSRLLGRSTAVNGHRLWLAKKMLDERIARLERAGRTVPLDYRYVRAIIEEAWRVRRDQEARP